MYEDKKKKALHTLEKKQIKVDEINKVRSRVGGGGQLVGRPRISVAGSSCFCPPHASHPSPSPPQVLTEDISPALDKLRREKVQYMEWQNATNSLEKLRRFCVAYKYVEAQK